MGVVDEADGEDVGVGGAAASEVGVAGQVEREEPTPRGGMRWVAGGTALSVVAAAAWWSGAGNGDSREIPVHEGTYGALIAGEHTLNSGPGDINNSNGSSHMKIQTTAAAALLGAAAGAFQAQAGDAVQWRVEDGGNGHWYRIDSIDADADYQSKVDYAHSRGATLTSISDSKENQFVSMAAQTSGVTCRLVIGGRRSCVSCNWNWIDGSAWTYSNWGSGEPGNGGAVHAEMFVGFGQPGSWADVDDSDGSCPQMMLEWSADCNADNIVDYGQILNGTLADSNANNIPDCCEPGNNCCVGDIYENHIIDGGDLGILLSEWGVVTPTTNSDLNRDGFVNGADLGMLLANWGPCGG